MEKFTFFWSGPFSNWYKCAFKVNSTTYNCTEQYMMYQKAILFNDMDIAQKILSSADPKEQKAFGREVKNFNPEKWNEACRDIVFEGNLAKYDQNKRLKDILLATAGTTLVEASPYDKIWGIGLTADDSRALSRETWRGKNWLGEVLTEVREYLIEG